MKGLRKMRENGKKKVILGSVFTSAFIIWTMLIQLVDVQPLGQNGTDIGFATLNCWFHRLINANMLLYTITDWMGLVPLLIGMVFAGIGLCQLIQRRSFFKVDFDILVLGVYYVVVIFCYLLFEAIPINYRPILIDGKLETSYPSSTTLLVITVMWALVEQALRRMKKSVLSKGITVVSVAFSLFMVIGRIISGVHWVTDIIGSVLLSIGLFYIYKGFVLIGLEKRKNRG